MNCIRSITAIATLLALSSAAAAQTIPDNVGKSSSGLPAQLQNVGFEPQLNAQLPLDVNFRDESGRDVRPAILIAPEDCLDPGQRRQREGRQTCLSTLGGCGVCRHDLAAPELELGEHGQGREQDGAQL